MIHLVLQLTPLVRKLYQGSRQAQVWWGSLSSEERERYLRLLRQGLDRSRTALERRLEPHVLARAEYFLAWARDSSPGQERRTNGAPRHRGREQNNRVESDRSQTVLEASDALLIGGHEPRYSATGERQSEGAARFDREGR